MPEKGSRSPASGVTAFDNLVDILKEQGINWSSRNKTSSAASDAVDNLRQELKQKGLRGFKRGGKVKKTGLAKVHKGERVLTPQQAKKVEQDRALPPPRLRAAVLRMKDR